MPASHLRGRRPNAIRGGIGTLVLALVAGLLPLLAIPPAAYAAVGELSFVDAASTAGNRSNHTVRIPTTVNAGDALILYLTTNSTTSTINDTVSGWTLLESRDGTGIRGRAWTKTAAAGDAGANVTVTTSAFAKSVIGVAAYRSTAQATVVASEVGAGTTSTASHTAPTVAVEKENSWLVSIWTEKSSTEPLTWTLPSDTTARTSAAATGTGKVSGVLGDSNEAVATGTAAGRTATTSAAVTRTVMLSVVVAPGEVEEPTNEAPTAEFTAGCSGLTCEFDASGSSDPDNDNLTYSWDFGDGSDNGTGVSPRHTYASDGPRTVTLTVSDGTLDDQATRDVNPTAAVSQGSISFVAAASTAGNRSGHTVRIPATVKPNDRLLLFLTTNSTSGTL